MTARDRQPRHEAFTLIELLVVVAIIALLISILLPGLNQARDTAKRVACASNERQAGLAFRMYGNDNDDAFPLGYWYNDKVSPTQNWSWDDLILHYLAVNLTEQQKWAGSATAYTNTKALLCPSDTTTKQRTYSMARAFGQGMVVNSFQSATAPKNHRFVQIKRPDYVITLVERANTQNTLGSPWSAVTDSPDLQLQVDAQWVHPPQFNYLFVDGHAEALTREQTVGDGDLFLPQGMWTRDPND